MRVVVVMSQPPHPEGNAPGRTSVGLIRGLRENGVEVVPVAARQHFAADVVAPSDLGVHVVDVAPRIPSWRSRADMLLRPRGLLSRGPFAQTVRELAADADILHLEETETAWVDLGIPIPSLVHMHYLIRRDRSLGSPLHKEYYSRLEFVLAERAAARRHSHLVASSPLVADYLRAAASRADVTVAPLTLDPLGYRQAPLDDPIAGVIGTAGWGPTEGSMRRLVTDVWPLVRTRAPDARLLVAGRGTDALGLESGGGVDILGPVASGAEFMQQISLLLYPIRRGSGMKVKVLEAIASGVPVVTTPEGAEGIEATPGVIVATEDAELADAAAELLRDGAARRERGAAALATFQRVYAPRAATRPLVELYERMAAAA